jgi:peptidoglycan/LPS O-acetylase OafA/YrhL
VAIAVVVVGHAMLVGNVAGLPGFFVGVDLFFVLSGFLITSLLINEWARTGSISLARFYMRRALRLLPALALFLAVVLSLLPWYQPSEARGDLAKAIAATALYVQNFAWVNNKTHHLTHLWSLSEEEQFYFVWPVLLMLLIHIRARHRAILGVLVTALLVDVGGCAFLYHQGGPHGAPFFLRFTPVRSEGLILGCILGLLYSRRWVPRPNRLGRTLPVAGSVAFALFIVIVANVNERNPRLYEGGWLAIALVCAACVYASVADPLPWPLRALTLRPVTYLGEISYALYIWHWPLLTMWPATLLPIGLRVAAAVSCAIVSFHLVEKPSLRLKARFTPVPDQREVVIAPLLPGEDEEDGGSPGPMRPLPERRQSAR